MTGSPTIETVRPKTLHAAVPMLPLYSYVLAEDVVEGSSTLPVCWSEYNVERLPRDPVGGRGCVAYDVYIWVGGLPMGVYADVGF